MILILFNLILFLFVFILVILFMKTNNFFKLKHVLLSSFKNLFGLEVKFFQISVFYSFVIFFFIFNFAFLGYFSYNYAFLGLMYFTFIFASISWLSALISFFKSESMYFYITKFGDGFAQTLIMLPIELASEFSRPFSLTIRLSVNILVGHFLMKGMYMLIFYFGLFYSYLIIFAVLLEMFVFLVQSFVFSILIIIYLNE